MAKKANDLNEESQLDLMRQEVIKLNNKFEEFEAKIGPLSVTEIDTTKVFTSCLEASINAVLAQTPLNILMSNKKVSERKEQLKMGVRLAVDLHKEVMGLYYTR
jgi:NADH/NAD ratio-sensing transcriptional regulator Rex